MFGTNTKKKNKKAPVRCFFVFLKLVSYFDYFFAFVVAALAANTVSKIEFTALGALYHTGHVELPNV